MLSGKLWLRLRWQSWVLRQIWKLSTLPGTLVGRFRVLRVAMTLLARYRLHRPAAKTHVIDLGAGLSFEVSDHTEALVLCEVFVDDGYARLGLPSSAEVVLDLGCNIGAASVWFKRRYPEARVISVEADPRIAEIARRNTQRLPGIEVENYAVAGETGTSTFSRQPGASWASGLPGATWASGLDGGGETITVPALSLLAMRDRFDVAQVDVLKIDVEGAEHDAFGDPSALQGVEVIVGEFHPREGENWAKFVAKLPGFDVTPAAAPSDRMVEFTAVRATPPFEVLGSA